MTSLVQQQSLSAPVTRMALAPAARDVSGIFVDIAGNLARRRSGAALHFVRTDIAVVTPMEEPR